MWNKKIKEDINKYFSSSTKEELERDWIKLKQETSHIDSPSVDEFIKDNSMELELNGEARSHKYNDLKLSIVYNKDFDDYLLCIYNKEIQIDANLPSNIGDVLSHMKTLSK